MAALNVSLFSYRCLFQKLPEHDSSLPKLDPPRFPHIIPATACGNSFSKKSRAPVHQTRSCIWCSLIKATGTYSRIEIFEIIETFLLLPAPNPFPAPALLQKRSHASSCCCSCYRACRLETSPPRETGRFPETLTRMVQTSIHLETAAGDTM